MLRYQINDSAKEQVLLSSEIHFLNDFLNLEKVRRDKFEYVISKEGDILDLAADCGIVNKSGAWYAYNGDKIGQGRENAKLFLKEHTDICDEIEKKVRIQYHLLPDEEGDTQETAATDSVQDDSEE